MRILITSILMLFLSVAFSNPVLDELEIVAQATNERGTIFVELASTPENLLGLLETLDNGSLVVITPEGTVGYVWSLSGSIISLRSMSWVEFAQVNGKSAATLFGLENLTYEQEGLFLNPERIRVDSVVRVRGGPSYHNGCISSSRPYRSDISCYSNGRLTYEVICTSNNVDYQVTCRSRHY